jgi:hypothetical protein
MMSDELTDLERRVIEKLLAGEHPVLEALREQFRTCRVKKRELTGCGFFTELEMSRSVKAAPTGQQNLRIGDVAARIAGLEHGAGFVLFVSGGYLDMLEGYSYDESWPESITDFELAYVDGSRDVAALQLDSCGTKSTRQ